MVGAKPVSLVHSRKSSSAAWYLVSTQGPTIKSTSNSQRHQFVKLVFASKNSNSASRIDNLFGF